MSKIGALDYPSGQLMVIRVGTSPLPPLNHRSKLTIVLFGDRFEGFARSTELISLAPIQRRRKQMVLECFSSEACPGLGLRRVFL